jgi:hypothetical protein
MAPCSLSSTGHQRSSAKYKNGSAGGPWAAVPTRIGGALAYTVSSSHDRWIQGAS